MVTPPFARKPLRALRRLSRGALFLAFAAVLCPAMAQVTDWEMFAPREREFSRARKQVDTMEISFGGRRVELRRTWSMLNDDERAAVRSIQPDLPEGDAPPFPRQGLKPLVERLHRVRGPAGQTLRVFLEVDDQGVVQEIGAGSRVANEFLGQLLALVGDSAFQPGSCSGKACRRVFAFDMRYVGD